MAWLAITEICYNEVIFINKHGQQIWGVVEMKTVKVQICFGTHCTMMGAMDLYEAVSQIRDELSDQEIEIQVVKCFGDCKSNLDAPVVLVNEKKITAATSEKVMAEIMSEVN